MSIAFFLTDSSAGITLNPEFDYVDELTKIEQRHRVRDGGQFRYKFGAFNMFNFSLRFVNSSDTYQINQWWTDNTSLFFLVNSDVYPVLISNDTKPIGRFVPPYDNLFEGNLILEGY